MDKSKIQAILKWEPPTKVTDSCSFIGLTNYYQRFIKGYSSIIVPLMDMLKKGRVWKWTDRCQAAFDRLKRDVIEVHVLMLLDFGKSLEVEMDASGYAVGGVLMQEGHPVAYESRKLSEGEWQYSV
ncbi:hypothetical protein CRG98_023083 [Punica granatum]|uniref:Reverse transcriptase/retrotransposon-derived protein RNase H-like domain-containing protein n=1 Tax=Punica granatum TaxID=22663 RepID=A0A2I0JJZ0_PUNGR|nr:hypothetical protein CRG98_023083 [Punica granatum]